MQASDDTQTTAGHLSALFAGGRVNRSPYYPFANMAALLASKQAEQLQAQVTEADRVTPHRIANVPLGLVPRRVSAVEPNVLEQLADLRIEIIALRNRLDVGLELLASGVALKDVARLLQTGADAEQRRRRAAPPRRVAFDGWPMVPRPRRARVARID